jgi:hypothetical protein
MKTPRSGNHSLWNRYPFFCHPDRSEAERRDLRFRGPFVEMFFDGEPVTLSNRLTHTDGICRGVEGLSLPKETQDAVARLL